MPSLNHNPPKFLELEEDEQTKQVIVKKLYKNHYCLIDDNYKNRAFSLSYTSQS